VTLTVDTGNSFQQDSNHGVYSSTIRCGLKSMGEGDFRPPPPPIAQRTLNRFSRNFKYTTKFPGHDRARKLLGATSTWLVWANIQFVTWKFYQKL